MSQIAFQYALVIPGAADKTWKVLEGFSLDKL